MGNDEKIVFPVGYHSDNNFFCSLSVNSNTFNKSPQNEYYI